MDNAKTFLRDNWNLLKSKDFNELYERAGTESDHVTSILFSVGINPLDYLKTVIPQNVFFLGNYPQMDFYILEGITKIDSGAFYSCTFNSITFPSTLVSVGEAAFFNSKSKVPITIPESVEIIGDSAFVNCNVINDIIIPETCEYIGQLAFCGCRNVKSIEVRNSDCELGNQCFLLGAGFAKLKSVTLPAKYKSAKEIRRIFGYKNTLELKKRVNFTWI